MSYFASGVVPGYSEFANLIQVDNKMPQQLSSINTVKVFLNGIVPPHRNYFFFLLHSVLEPRGGGGRIWHLNNICSSVDH